jgi:hypothetical protein
MSRQFRSGPVCGGAFGPAVFIHQRDDACPRRRTPAVRCLPQHNAADVPAGYPALLVVAERPQLAAIERKRLYRDQRFVQTRC